jgi:hypothetical protein
MVAKKVAKSVHWTAVSKDVKPVDATVELRVEQRVVPKEKWREEVYICLLVLIDKIKETYEIDVAFRNKSTRGFVSK